MRAWIGALLVVGLSLGCSGGGATNDGGAGSGGGVGGRGGQAGGVAGQAGGVAGQAGGAAGQAGGAAGQAGGAAGQAGGASGQGGTAGAGGSGGGGTSGGSGRGGNGGASGASGRGGSSGASGSGGSTDGGISGCGMLNGLAFDSLDLRECGLAPPDSGDSRCHWRISFISATTFTWHHSDYIESGTFTCSANTITAQTQTRGTLTVTLDPTAWRFTWDGVVYACTSCPP